MGRNNRPPLSFLDGVDNRSHQTRLGDGYVRRADNVDIDSEGVGKLRDGYDLWVDLPGAHSMWDHELLSFALVADATKLYRLDPDGTLIRLVDGLNGGDLCYAMIAQRVRWSNTVQTGMVDLEGVSLPLGVETPLPSFAVTASSAGGLSAGKYGVTMTFTNASREEGGAADTTYVDVAEGGGILVTGIPESSDGSAVAARIYATTTNGTDLLYAGSAQPGQAQILIGAGDRSRLLTTQFCEPFPAVTQMLTKGGRLLGAVGRDLFWSVALYYGLYRPTKDGLRFPDKITMLAAPDGPSFLVYVGTANKVYVLQGDSIDNCTTNVACGAGAIKGSMKMVPAEALHMDGVLTPIPLWAGTDGVPYAGTAQGVIPLSKVFAGTVYAEAAAAFVEMDGLSRYIVSGRGGRVSGLAAVDRCSMEVVQAGG